MLKLFTSAFLFLSVATHAQSLSPAEAKKLSATLTDSKRDTIQINVLLRLAKYHVFKPGEIKTDLDSAADLIKKAENINSDIRSKWADGYVLLIKSYYLKESGDRDHAKDAVTNAVAILKNESDKNLAGEAYGELAGYFGYNVAAELDERIELVKSAISYFTQSGNIQQKAANLQMLGDLYNIKGNSTAALENLQAALDAYKSINYPQVQGIYTLMGFIYTRTRKYALALDRQLLALKTAQSAGDSSMQLCQIYNYLGEIYFALSDKERAIENYGNAYNVAKRHRDITSIYLTSVNVANVWASLKKPYKALEIVNNTTSSYKMPQNPNIEFSVAKCYVNAYCQVKQYEKARPYANRILNMINTLRMNDYSSIAAYSVAIPFFISAGETSKATELIDKHNEIAKKIKDGYYLAINQKLRFMLDSTTHNYASALAHLVESSRLNDSFIVQSKRNEIAALQVQFDTKEKENDIIAKKKDIQLLTRQSQLQEAKLEQSRLTRNFMIAAAVLLLLVLALVFRGYMIKRKNNRVLSEQRAQINEQNKSLQGLIREQQKLLGEKEWLLKEIHHRVKNNLQVVMSLLNSQSAYIDNEPALTAIHDSQHRVHAMSLIHQKLYNTENVSTIDMSFYIRELVTYLSDCFNTGQRIRFDLDIEPLSLDVSQAIPLGLILNEAITNSIKYAFPNDRKGEITISLVNTDHNNHLLTISDNGVGMPVHLRSKKPGSLGMSLIAGLSEDLDGRFSIENNNGIMIKISFVQDINMKRRSALTESFVTSN